VYTYLLSIVASSTISYTITRILIPILRAKGFTSIDVHKPNKPTVANMGGIGILISILITYAIIIFLGTSYSLYVKIMTIMAVILIAAILGILDDLKPIKGLSKTFLSIPTIIPIILSAMLNPQIIIVGRPEVPIVGKLRLTIAYWLLLPLAIAGPANAVNMLEVMNGIMPITCSLALIPIIFAQLFLGRMEDIILTTTLLGALLGYLPFNRYPAKIFSGNVGSLLVGAYIGAIAVISRVEAIAVIALMPHLINAFLVISSVGFKERRDISERPVKVGNNGLIYVNPSKHAPITLVRFIVLISGPLKEKDIVKVITYLQICASILALLTIQLYNLKI